MILIPTLLLTTFISVNGQLQEVPIDSPEAVAYETQTETDIGKPEYFEEIINPELEPIAGVPNIEFSDSVNDSDILPFPEVETPDVVTATDDTQLVDLLENTVNLLAENSASATGTINNTILGLMDRIIDEYPSYYTYAGFKTSADDSYASTLFIAKKATRNGRTIQFSDDCIKVEFNRYTYNNYNNYIYYTVTDSPNATVDVNNQTIVYTNVLDGYPSLGTKSVVPEYYIWIFVFVVFAAVIMSRRRKHD